MKNNSLVALFLCILNFTVVSAYATTLKIVNLAPNQKIQIGNKLCGIGDLFDANDTIYWNEKLENQAIKVICKQDCKGFKSPRECSKHENERKSGEYLSVVSLKSLVSQGDDNADPIILWPGELLLLDGVSPENGYEYYCRVQGYLKKFDVVKKDGTLYVNADDFYNIDNVETEITLEIYKNNSSQVGDVSIIKVIDVELTK